MGIKRQGSGASGASAVRATSRTKARAKARVVEEEPKSGKKAVEARPGLKLRRIQIRNYKAIDELDLEIPPPRMPGDPDILVIGSKNGVGKTSVLEACSFAALAACLGKDGLIAEDSDRLASDLIVRAGELRSEVRALLMYNDATCEAQISINRGQGIDFNEPVNGVVSGDGLSWSHIVDVDVVQVILGFEQDPLLAPPLLYLHGYRRVSGGNVDLRQIIGEPQSPDQRRPSLNVFKTSVVSSLMSRAGLFEGLAESDTEVDIGRLNELMSRFAGVTIEKLRPSANNTIELRVSPVGGGPSYAFDGLSSGQKEIISTLFLIWRYTRDQPGIVLIDEPELHLNAEWHGELVGALASIAPHNQYILATHSEDVFASVSADRRVLISPTGR